ERVVSDISYGIGENSATITAYSSTDGTRGKKKYTQTVDLGSDHKLGTSKDDNGVEIASSKDKIQVYSGLDQNGRTVSQRFDDQERVVWIDSYEEVKDA